MRRTPALLTLISGVGVFLYARLHSTSHTVALPDSVAESPRPAAGTLELVSLNLGHGRGTARSQFRVDAANVLAPHQSNAANGRAHREVFPVLAGDLGRAQRAGHDPQIEGVIESFEMAYRMQAIAPDVFDLERETRETKELYGVDQEPTDGFARQCLLARRMAEAGVRFVQVSTGYHWDHHGNIERDLPDSAAQTDKPAAALIEDLDRRGLLDDTLVVWAGEFGRTPVAQIDRGAPGRDHNPHGYTIWMAGGGVKPGYAHGATDDFGYLAIEDKVHMHDLHATILHLLGLDHERLTYRYAGRDFRLTDVYGRVVEEVIA